MMGKSRNDPKTCAPNTQKHGGHTFPNCDTPNIGVTETIGAPLFNSMFAPDKMATTIINLALQSAWMRPITASEYRPLNLLLIGKAGIGKSRLIQTMKTLNQNYLDFVAYKDILTPKFFIEFLKKAEKGEKRVLAIPDFQCITHSHGRKTQGTTISLMRQMTAEGICEVDSYGMDFHPDFPVKAGLITATTIQDYHQFAVAWKRDGFLSRLIPFSFDHTTQTRNSILDSIIHRKPDPLKNFKYRITRKMPKILRHDELLYQLRGYADDLGKKWLGNFPTSITS